jgi:transcriptional regulator with XRE-family HTH domain
MGYNINMSDLKQLIAQNLVELRKSRKYTQQDIANMVQYSDKAVSKWEKGESLPDIEVLYQICNIYGVTLDYLTHDGS